MKKNWVWKERKGSSVNEIVSAESIGLERVTQFKKKIETLSNELKQDCLTERPDPGIFQTKNASEPIVEFHRLWFVAYES